MHRTAPVSAPRAVLSRACADPRQSGALQRGRGVAGSLSRCCLPPSFPCAQDREQLGDCWPQWLRLLLSAQVALPGPGVELSKFNRDHMAKSYSLERHRKSANLCSREIVCLVNFAAWNKSLLNKGKIGYITPRHLG